MYRYDDAVNSHSFLYLCMTSDCCERMDFFTMVALLS